MANSEHAEDNHKLVKMPDAVAPVSSAPGVDTEAACVPSFAAASELLSAPYSCLVLNTHRRHIALPPVYLNKKKTGIREELDAELLKFSQSMSGVPLAYDNIRVVGHQGDIYDDSGYIHLNIEASFIVFQPKKGQTLLGKVNKLGANHVGCLVHGCFNASITKPNLVSVETWRDAGPQIGSEFEFDVIALDADTAGVLLIRGRLSRTRVQELLAVGESTVSTVHSTVLQPDEPTETPPEETPKKKKKKKKDKIKEEAPITPEKDTGLSTTVELNWTMEETIDETNGNAEKKKKKKKKKDKIKEEVPITPEKDTGLNTTVELNWTMEETIDETNGNTEKKKKKKKKKDKIKEEEREELVTAPFIPEQDTPLDTTMGFNVTMEETNGNVEKKKKKTKKDKHIKEEPEEMELSTMEVPGSDSSGYLSDKSSKKRKHQPESYPYVSPEFEMPSKKKIKTLIELKTEYEF